MASQQHSLCRSCTLRTWLAMGFALLAIPAAPVEGGRTEPLKILLTGDIYPCPAITLSVMDPAYEYTALQTREIEESEARRYVRLYFPRTDEALHEFTALFFVDADMAPFTGRQTLSMVEAVRGGHCGTFWTFGPHYDSVVSSGLGQVVPHEMFHDFQSWAKGHDFYRVKFRRDRPSVFTPFIELGVEDVRAYGFGHIVPRQGTTIWGEVIPYNWPWIVTWRFGGGGLCWVAADDLDHPWWSRETYGFSENRYAVDVLANIIRYTGGRALPDDITLPIRFRRELFEYAGTKSLLVSTLEFVEKFGADTSHLYQQFLEIDRGIVGPAKDSYLEGVYDVAVEGIRAGNEEVIAVVELALKARDMALLWVFLVEWLAVSGTSMISGFVVWSLMVRRKVYKQVVTTRLNAL